MPLRTGRFKKSILTPERARSFAEQNHEEFQHILSQNLSHESELIAEILVRFHQLYCGKLWKGARHSDSDLQSLPRFDNPSLEIFRNYTLKSLPCSVARSLCLWRTGRYSLKLLNYKPSPLELLKMQVQGFRCVSLLSEDWGAFIDFERDVFSFAIHDLIHADHFFSQPQLFELQKYFYEEILRLTEKGFFETARLTENSKTLLEYIFSDMNSHPVHLFKTLKAALDLESQNLVPQMLEMTTWSPQKRRAFQNLNSPLEDDQTHLDLMQA